MAMALGTANDAQCKPENASNKSEKSHIESMPTSNVMDENQSIKGMHIKSEVNVISLYGI